MKKVAFVVSHLGSGSLDLMRVLNKNPRVVIHNQSVQYTHPTDLDWLYKFGHKLDNTAAVYGDHLVNNVSFSCKALYDHCLFIYVVRSAKPTLHEIISHNSYTLENAASYYAFRLRRICEMAKQTPGAVMLTWEDLANEQGLPLIDEYLGLKESLRFVNEFEENCEDHLEHSVIEKAQDAYERHLYYLKQLDLNRVT